MPRKYYKRKRFTRRSYKKRGKKSSLVKKILAVTNPPKIYQYHGTNSIANAVNKKTYVDVDWLSHGGTSIGFMSRSHISAALSEHGLSLADANEGYWMLSAKRVYEITNIGNANAYLKICINTPRKPVSYGGVLSFIRTITNDTNLYTDAGTLNVLGTEIAGGAHYSSELVYDDAFTSVGVRMMTKTIWRLKTTKEIMLAPQQTFKFIMKRSKPFLYTPREWAISSTDVQLFPGISQNMLISLTGQTSRATTSGNPVPADPKFTKSSAASVAVNVFDEVKFVSRSSNKSTIETVDYAGSNFLPSGTSFKFGEDNNGAVAIV